ncbi:hypothetical protein EC968_007806 [Mortierella alpina]|nr:hypothetical protein EC968_007806 [Mortierella alpina]
MTDPAVFKRALLSTPTRLRVEPNDVFFRDGTSRAWLLRGVNLSGSCKFPKYPVPVPSHVGGDAFLRTRAQAPNVSGLKPAVHANAECNSDVHRERNGPPVEGSDHSDLKYHNDPNTSGAIPQRCTDSDHAHTERISFVGRPFELDEADEHLARLRHWGFRMIRWVVTWEAIEHQGPGIYDQQFLDYTVKALLKAKEYGFKVMIDFHQDVWSRFSGGSGAPLWTFYAAGLDPHHFAATGAAVVHNTLQDHEPLLRMVWLTNYYKLACASMFTLFYAGKILAPQCTFDNGVNIQDYLQSHFLSAIEALVERIHQCTDSDGKNLLEDEVVIGYDSWNEPSCGWIGLECLDRLPEQHDMRQGDMPTPLQSLMLGEGIAVSNVETYQLKIIGPVKSGVRTIDPSAHPTARDALLLKQGPVKAWLTPQRRDEYDRRYGLRRDRSFPKAGECLWAQHGVWSISEQKILQQDYFSRGPSATTRDNPLEKRRLIDWVQDHWLPFARHVTERIRKVHPTAILFLEPPVYSPPPDLVQPSSTDDADKKVHEELLTNMAYAPHHYDDLVLLTKRYLGWINIDLLGLSRGRHKSLLGSIVLGAKATTALFGLQIREIQDECHKQLGRRPVLIGETGLHFDVGLDNTLQAGSRALNGTSPLGKDKPRRSSWYSFVSAMRSEPCQQDLRSTVSRQFEQAFDNILQGLDQTLAHYTLWNYTVENETRYGDGWNGENLSLYSADAYGVGLAESGLNRGGRAIEQFCRPYPIATVGQPVVVSFDRHAKVFKMETRTRDASTETTTTTTAAAAVGGSREQLQTEVYVPRLHFAGPEQCRVRVSDGSWHWDREEQILRWEYEASKDEQTHWLEIRACSRTLIPHAGLRSSAPAAAGVRQFSASSSASGRGGFPWAAVALILGGISLTGFGLFQFYTSGVNRFPEGIRDDLRKALYYQNYSSDVDKNDKAIAFYRSALNAAMQHPDLRVDGEEVTGIMIQLGTLFQEIGRVQEAIEVLGMAFECLVHGRTLGTGNESVRGGGGAKEDSSSSSTIQGQTSEFEGQSSSLEQSEPEHQHGPRRLDGPTRLKAVGIAQKLGDLYHSIRKDQQAERYYLWSVEQLLKNHEGVVERQSNISEEERRLQNARDQEAMRKQFNFDKLPSWMTKTDLGASLEALGGFYTSKGVYSNALPLYMRALSLVDQNSCHAAVLMCNISDAFAGLGNVEDATGWAERGLKVGSAQSGQECDEGCGVILYNLGMLHEMKGDVMKAQDYYRQSKQHGLKTGFNQSIVESNKALKRLKDANEGTQA